LDLGEAIRKQVRARNASALHRLWQVEHYAAWLKKDLSSIAANSDMQVIFDTCCGQPEVSLARSDLVANMQRTSAGVSFASGPLHRSFLLGKSQQDFDPCISELKHHKSSVNCVAYSPDGSLLASASEDQTVAIWNTKTGIVEFVLKGHTAAVSSVAWSPDGQQLATGETQLHVPMMTRGVKHASV
jgi:WD40 repeat protein